ncbi:MAG: phosphoribosylglycinamide formyltransferase [Deltaproteobacteria bacterium]|nr:phosphoribosylglycinamide formyltransferase [Deltaproteobacteria bacterium]
MPVRSVSNLFEPVPSHTSVSLGTQKVRVAVLVSGNGSNLQSIIDHIEEGKLNASIACVISNREDAFALERAKKHQLPSFYLNHRSFSDRRSFDAAVLEIVREHSAELVVLAGFNRILSTVLLDAFPLAILNIHPALLPAFPGNHAQRLALQHGVKIAGCTVHFVDPGTDTGPIIAQAAVPVLDGDTEETLSRRILREEHRLYPGVIRLFTEGRIRVEGRRVFISPGEQDSSEYLENPRF